LMCASSTFKSNIFFLHSLCRLNSANTLFITSLPPCVATIQPWSNNEI
jgi:hypothetical protein